ncbi:TPA: zinc-dependent metalloprotease [Bacillus cereus]|nr:zinc-dependent metalloprotease [Bacillus cereus]
MNLKRMIIALACSALLLVPFTSISTHAQEIDIHQQSIPSKLPVIGDPLPKVNQDKVTTPLHPFSPSNIKNSNSFFHTLAATRTVTILIAADEEYRAAHPDWKSLTKQLVEKAGQSFLTEHNIQFSVVNYTTWKSDGYDSASILYDLNTEWGNTSSYDFVIGFTKDTRFTAGGIAYMYPSAPPSGISVIFDLGTLYTPYAIQHEISHNYGLPHDASGSGIKCMMNYDYAYSVKYWDASHDALLESHRNWYGY